MHTGKNKKRPSTATPATVPVHHSHQLNPIIPRPRQSSFNLNNNDIAVLLHGHRELRSTSPYLALLWFFYFYFYSTITITILPRPAERWDRIFPFAEVNGVAKCPTRIRYAREFAGEGRGFFFSFLFFSNVSGVVEAQSTKALFPSVSFSYDTRWAMNGWMNGWVDGHGHGRVGFFSFSLIFLSLDVYLLVGLGF